MLANYPKVLLLCQMQNSVKRVLRMLLVLSLSLNKRGVFLNKKLMLFIGLLLLSFHIMCVLRINHFMFIPIINPCLAMQVNKVASERMYRWALAFTRI